MRFYIFSRIAVLLPIFSFVGCESNVRDVPSDKMALATIVTTTRLDQTQYSRSLLQFYSEGPAVGRIVGYGILNDDYGNTSNAMVLKLIAETKSKERIVVSPFLAHGNAVNEIEGLFFDSEYMLSDAIWKLRHSRLYD